MIPSTIPKQLYIGQFDCHYCDQKATRYDSHGRPVCRSHGTAKPVMSHRKIRPNDLCDCGSKKKYKHCCRKTDLKLT